MTAMTQSEKEAFLAEVHVGVMSVNRAEAGPLTVPIWYDYEPGGQIWFLTGRSSMKRRLLDVGTHVAMCAQSEDLPYRYVTAEGPVVSIDEPTDELLGMAVRYLGEEMGAQYVGRGDSDSVVVRVQPSRWLGVDYSKRSA